jgi:hypothetical protein
MAAMTTGRSFPVRAQNSRSPTGRSRRQVRSKGQHSRIGHEHPLDRPLADVLEQEVPLGDVTEFHFGIDDDRLEPIDDTERSAEDALLGGAMGTWGR